MTLQELKAFTSQAVEAGVQAYIKHIEPERDRIKQAEAKRYIAKLGYQPVMLRKWTEAKLLTKQKSGTQQSATAWYSLAEIKGLLSTLRLKEICNNQNN